MNIVRLCFPHSLLVVLLMLSAEAGAQQRFQHPAGFELTLPPGWSAQPHQNGQFQLVPPDPSATEALLLLAMPSDGAQRADDASVIDGSEAEVQKLFPVMQRQGPPQRFDTGLGAAVRLDFGGTVDGTAVHLSLYLAVADGTAISLMAVGTFDDIAPRSPELATMFASLGAAGSDGFSPDSFAAAPDSSMPAPAPSGVGLDDGSAIARPWSQRLAGSRLVVMSGYSSGGSGGMNSRHDLELYADGRFHLHGSSSVSMSVDGLSGSSASQEDERGRWRVIAHSSSAVLELNLDSGERQFGELTRSGEQTFLNGTRVYVTEL